ncbi:MAG: hypothetical protein ABI700_16140 [Chloroflexota bacterium]
MFLRLSRRVTFTGLFLFLLLLALPTFAQDATPEATTETALPLTHTYHSYIVSLGYPADWRVEADATFASTRQHPFRILVNSGDLPAYQGRLVRAVLVNLDLVQTDDMQGYIEEFTDNLSDSLGHPIAVEPIRSGNRDGVMFHGTNDPYDETFLVFRYDANYLLTLNVIAPPGDMENWLPTALAIADSLRLLKIPPPSVYDPLTTPAPSAYIRVTFYATGAHSDDNLHYSLTPGACATIHWSVTGTAQVFIGNLDGGSTTHVSPTGTMKTSPVYGGNQRYMVYTAGIFNPRNRTILSFSAAPATSESEPNSTPDSSCN